MKRGFTLIELLVVVLIIGILSSVALPQYTKAVNKAKVTEVWSLGKAFFDAQNVYVIENGGVSDDLDDLSYEFPANLKDWTMSYEVNPISVGSSSTGLARLFFQGKGSLEEAKLEYNYFPPDTKAIRCTGGHFCAYLLPCTNKIMEDTGTGYISYNCQDF